MQKAMGSHRASRVLGLLLCLAALWPAPRGRATEPQPRPGRAGDAAGLHELLARVSADRMLADVVRLAHPELAGRQTGTAADLRSAEYVLEQFREPGRSVRLRRPPEDADDPTLLSESLAVTRIRGGTTLELLLDQDTRALSAGADYLPILDSSSVDAWGRVTFVGYGIADPARGFDEYDGIDVRDRIVLFLRGTPSSYPHRWSHAEKVRTARERGAIAFLTATGPIRSAYEVRRGIPAGPLASYGLHETSEERALPGAWISTEAAASLVASAGLSLKEVQRRMGAALFPRSRPLRAWARLQWEADSFPGTLHNVVLRYPAHPVDERVDESPGAIVIGAHRDHFGTQAGLLFPGADDNASGTAVMLEVARVLRGAGVQPARTLVFVSFSGEEQGLLGSRLYVRRPPVPLRDTTAMINLDHVGVGDGRLTVGVAGLPKEVAARAAALAGLEDRVDLYGYFPGGDHVPFREAGVPTVTVVSGGPHRHYHQPTDHPGTIRPGVLGAAARYVLALVWLLAYQP